MKICKRPFEQVKICRRCFNCSFDTLSNRNVRPLPPSLTISLLLLLLLLFNELIVRLTDEEGVEQLVRIAFVVYCWLDRNGKTALGTDSCSKASSQTDDPSPDGYRCAPRRILSLLIGWWIELGVHREMRKAERKGALHAAIQQTNERTNARERRSVDSSKYFSEWKRDFALNAQIMLEESHVFQRAASSAAYASMAAFTAAANMYNSFYPTTYTTADPMNYMPCSGKNRSGGLASIVNLLLSRWKTRKTGPESSRQIRRHGFMDAFLFIGQWNDNHQVNSRHAVRCWSSKNRCHSRNGRRLFPNFRVSVSDLDPNMKYMFLLDIVPMDDNRYKYHESAWTISGKAEPHIYGR